METLGTRFLDLLQFGTILVKSIFARGEDRLRKRCELRIGETLESVLLDEPLDDWFAGRRQCPRRNQFLRLWKLLIDSRKAIKSFRWRQVRNGLEIESRSEGQARDLEGVTDNIVLATRNRTLNDRLVLTHCHPNADPLYNSTDYSFSVIYNPVRAMQNMALIVSSIPKYNP